MKSLETAKTLEKAFRNRGLRQHRALRSVQAFEHGANQALLIFDLAVNRKVLSSKSFAGFNYFKEGETHHATKLIFHRILDTLCTEIKVLAPRIRRHMEKRQGSIRSPLDFATLFVRLCLGQVMARLMAVPLKTALRALRERQNVFFFYFHPIRQQRANVAPAPASDETEEAGAFPFGLGTHSCIGKRFSLAILEIADDLVKSSFADGFATASRLTPDGAFLAFSDTV